MTSALVDVPAFQSGNSLHPACAAHQCQAYSIGVVDALHAMRSGADVRRFCIDPNVTQGQVGDIVAAYLARHPEVRHRAAAALVAMALEEAFPCK